MNLQLYNTLPEWALKISSGKDIPEVIIQKIAVKTEQKIKELLPNGINVIDTDKRGTDGNLNILLGTNYPFV